MRSVPGVLVDRVNIGGNETGQQSNFHLGSTSFNAISQNLGPRIFRVGLVVTF